MNTSPASSHCGESASDTPHPIETLLHDVSEEMRSIAKEAQAASCLVTETIGTLEAKLKAKREKLLDSIDKLCWSQLDVCESKQRRLFALQEKHATFVQISQQLIGGQVSDTDTILLADSVARNHDIVVREMRSERGTAARRKIAAVCTSIDTINDDFDALLSIEVEPAMSFDLPPLPPDINSDGIQLTLGIDRPVDVVWVSSPCRVWCQAITDEEAWGTVTTQLSHLHTHPVAVADGPTVGSIYAAHHARYGEWYRARVLAVNNDSCLMFFIDFGDVENVTFDNISVLPKKIASLALPSQAIQCCLSGFTNRTCSPEDCEYLTGRFVDAGLVLLRVVRGPENGLPPAVVFCDAQNTNLSEKFFAELDENYTCNAGGW